MYMNKSENIKSVVDTKSMHDTCAGKNDFYWFYCQGSIVIFMYRRKRQRTRFCWQVSKSKRANTTTTKLHSTFLTAKQNHAICTNRVINLLLTIYAVSAWNLSIEHLNSIYYVICFSIIRVRILSPLGFESTRFYFIIFHTYIRYESVFYETNQIRRCHLIVMTFQFSFLYTDRNSTHACTFNSTVN